MNTLFQVQTKLTLEDYLCANNHLATHSPRSVTRICLLILIPLMAFVFFPWQDAGSYWSWRWKVLALLAAAIFIFLVGSISRRRSIRRQWDRVSAIREPRTYRFSEEGLENVAESSRGFARWDQIARAETVGDLLLLTTVQSTHYIIPEEAFADSDELLRFKELVRSRVPDTGGLH